MVGSQRQKCEFEKIRFFRTIFFAFLITCFRHKMRFCSKKRKTWKLRKKIECLFNMFFTKYFQKQILGEKIKKLVCYIPGETGHYWKMANVCKFWCFIRHDVWFFQTTVLLIYIRKKLPKVEFDEKARLEAENKSNNPLFNFFENFENIQFVLI